MPYIIPAWPTLARQAPYRPWTTLLVVTDGLSAETVAKPPSEKQIPGKSDLGRHAHAC